MRAHGRYFRSAVAVVALAISPSAHGVDFVFSNGTYVPGTWALLLAGLGAMGALARRRRR